MENFFERQTLTSAEQARFRKSRTQSPKRGVAEWPLGSLNKSPAKLRNLKQASTTPTRRP